MEECAREQNPDLRDKLQKISKERVKKVGSSVLGTSAQKRSRVDYICIVETGKLDECIQYIHSILPGARLYIGCGNVWRMRDREYDIMLFRSEDGTKKGMKSSQLYHESLKIMYEMKYLHRDEDGKEVISRLKMMLDTMGLIRPRMGLMNSPLVYMMYNHMRFTDMYKPVSKKQRIRYKVAKVARHFSQISLQELRSSLGVRIATTSIFPGTWEIIQDGLRYISHPQNDPYKRHLPCGLVIRALGNGRVRESILKSCRYILPKMGTTSLGVYVKSSSYDCDGSVVIWIYMSSCPYHVVDMTSNELSRYFPDVPCSVSPINIMND